MAIEQLEEPVRLLVRSEVTVNNVNSVIKELLENSIDSGAKTVKMELVVNLDGSVIDLTCTDDGEGVREEDMDFLGRRWYTSKVGQDLVDVKTFGFRGEALSSIMKVSNKLIVTSRSKERGDGFEISFIDGERVGGVRRYFKAMDVGTVVKIKGLFDSVGVRKRVILSGIGKGLSQFVNSVKHSVVCCSANNHFVSLEIDIVISKDGCSKIQALSFDNAEKGASMVTTQMALLKGLYGNIFKDYEICKVQFEDCCLTVAIAFSVSQSKQYQFMFLNGRPLVNRKLQNEVNTRYQHRFKTWGFKTKHGNNDKEQHLKMHGRPFSTNGIYVANFETPVEVSDLTQDPAKVCYESERITVLIRLFEKAVDVFFGIQKSKRNEMEISGFMRKKLGGKKEKLSSRRSEEDSEGSKVGNEASERLSVGDLSQSEMSSVKRPKWYASGLQLKREDYSTMQVVGQADDKYIVVRHRDHLLALDQHACSERLNVEKLYQELIVQCVSGKAPAAVMNKGDEVAVKSCFEFAAFDRELVKQYRQELQVWGFHFNEAATTMQRVPSMLISRPLGVVTSGVSEYVFNIAQGYKPKTTTVLGKLDTSQDRWWLAMVPAMPSILVEAIKSAACRSAVLFGQHLDREQCAELVAKLAYCQSPQFCAHGRRGVVKMINLTTS